VSHTHHSKRLIKPKPQAEWLSCAAACALAGVDPIELYGLSQPEGPISKRKVNRGVCGTQWQYRREDVARVAEIKGRGMSR